MNISKFITELDLARQSKILSGETATFDGKIEAGIPFSGYPTGVDISTVVSLGVVSSQLAMLSGNTGTTVFDVSNPSSPYYNPSFDGYSANTWTNPLFSANTSGLTLPITTLSSETQTVGPIWTLTQTGMTGDYVIGLEYTGYSISYSFFQVFSSDSGVTFTGVTNASQENFSAGTLDYKGPLDYISSVEDATVDGRLITNKLTVTGGASSATTNYVLTQVDDTGKAEWLPLTGALTGYCLGDITLNSIDECGSGISINSRTFFSTSNATGTLAFSIGFDNLSSGNFSHSEGRGTTAIGNYSHSEGRGTVTSGQYSHSEGFNTSATTFYSHSEGDNTLASGYASHAEGENTIASGEVSHAEGRSTIASGDYSHAEGYLTNAYGQYSHAEGSGTTSYGIYSHAEGSFTNSIGEYSHAEGYFSVASGKGSHAEGGYFTGVFYLSGGTASGDASHAEGYLTIASGISSHAEGVITIAGGKGSHAEGTQTQATNEGSQAEGADTISSGVSAHAEGNNTTASGDNSHSEGNFTQAIGNESHAGGNTTIASGQTSFVHGFNSVAGGNTTIVLGSNITGSTDNTTYVNNLIVNSGGTSSKLGINIEPQYVVDVLGNTSRLYYEPSVLGGYLTLSGNTNIPRINVLVPASGSKPSAGGSVGFRCWDDVSYDGYGKVGDMFIYSSTESNGLNIISTDGTNTEDYIRFYVGGDANVSSALAMHITGTGATKGYVAINNTSPTQRLDVNGNGRFRSIGSSASAGALHYTADGTLTTNTSDERLKENIEPISNTLEKIKEIQGVTYQWKDRKSGGDDVKLGFIAQQLENVDERLVFTNKLDGYKGIHIDGVVSLLVESIKEQQSIIEKLNEEINSLKVRLDNLGNL